MIDQIPAIIVLAPLFGAMIIGLFGIRDHRVCLPVVFISLLVSLGASVAAAQQVFNVGTINYFVGGWEKPLGIGIHLKIDALNSLVLVVIGVVVMLVSFFSIRRVGERDTEKTPYFYILYLLLCVGLFGITITSDAFNLFVLIEVSSLTSYALIAMGSNKRGTVAAFNYVIMGTVGASFYLLGVGYLYLKTGSLNMDGIHAILMLETNDANVGASKATTVAFIFILVGIWIKMAFFPLYGWLPNAYTYCPSTSSCILAPLMTKVSVYVMIRVMITVFGLDWVFVELGWSQLVVWLAVIAILAGSMLALAQREIKKMLCYLIVAEVGYMVGGAWLADPDHWGMTGALYHILADAMMTLCLFLFAGIVAKRLGAFEISDLQGLFKKMPITSIGLVIGALAMIGVPPTCGFFSKFYLIRGAIEGGHWEFVAALLISSLVNAVLFFRIFEIAYFGNKPAEGHDHSHDHSDDSIEEGKGSDSTVLGREASWSSLFPLLASAAIIILLGVFNGEVVALIRVTFENSNHLSGLFR